MKKMQIGHIVDYCIDYNKRNQTADDEADTNRPKSKRYRMATQAEIDAYFGG